MMRLNIPEKYFKGKVYDWKRPNYITQKYSCCFPALRALVSARLTDRGRNQAGCEHPWTCRPPTQRIRIPVVSLHCLNLALTVKYMFPIVKTALCINTTLHHRKLCAFPCQTECPDSRSTQRKFKFSNAFPFLWRFFSFAFNILFLKLLYWSYCILRHFL